MGAHDEPFRRPGKPFEDPRRPFVPPASAPPLVLTLPWRRGILNTLGMYVVAIGLAVVLIATETPILVTVALIGSTSYLALLYHLGGTRIVLDTIELRVAPRRIWRPFSRFTIPRADLVDFVAVLVEDPETRKTVRARLEVLGLRGQRTITTTNDPDDARSAASALRRVAFGRDPS